MDSQPLISVVIPTFNRVTLVARAIRSALGQTYRNIEVVVVDDGSKDETQEVIGAIGDPRVRLLIHETNRGGSLARNTGIASSRGEFIAFLDSDDEWLPEKLELQVDALRKRGSPFAYCKAYMVRKAGSRRVLPREPFCGGNLLKYVVCDGGFMQTSGYVVRRDFVIPFDQTCFPHDDWDWILRFYHQNQNMIFVEHPLYYYRGDALVRSADYGGDYHFKKSSPFLEKYRSIIESEPCISRYFGWTFAQDALARGEKATARRLLRQYRVYPSLFQKPKAWRAWLKSLG